MKIVIGYRGETLKKLERESSCRIRFDTYKNALTRFLTLTGFSSSINQAKTLIEQIITDAHFASASLSTTSRRRPSISYL